MSKQIYIPTMDELYTIQDMNINVYNYLLAKVIEVLTLEGVVWYNKGILKNEYKYFRENAEIVRAICSMYPEELQYSEIGKYDLELCLDMMEENDNSLYNLDRLALFNESTINNIFVTRTVIDKLAKGLIDNPKYRFEYRENSLLNSIFSTEFINNMFYEMRMLENLSIIEPAYVLKTKNLSKTDQKELLEKAIKAYISRYKLSQYNGSGVKDILTNPDLETKRLIKCIEKRRNNKY